jgi:hypothetical protein
MQQIADWLEKLGMSEYAERFAENDIDIAVLRHLTDQDLKELGVSLGHRRKMLAAIAQLNGTSIGEAPIPAPGILKPQPPVASTSPPTPDAAGERRHVTVMFCDLVDSTGIASKLDAEEWRDLVGARAASTAVLARCPCRYRRRLGWDDRGCGGPRQDQPNSLHATDARRGPPHGGEHRQAARAAARAAAEGVTRLQPHISRQSAQCPLL